MARKIKCRRCGERFDPDCEGAYVDGIGDCCDGCYKDETFECCACGERDASDIARRTMLVVAGDVRFLCAGKAKPGLYRIVACPYYGGPLIGGGYLFDEALEFLAPLPPGLNLDGYPCGHLCRECQAIAVGDCGKTERDVIRSRIAAFRNRHSARNRSKVPIRFRVGSMARYGKDTVYVVGHAPNGAGTPGAYVVEVHKGRAALHARWVGSEEYLKPIA
ncbi:MAG: hypothetical protein WCX88_03275 [Patescibacteria group bacterium]